MLSQSDMHRALVIDVMRLGRDVGHAGISVGGAHGVADGFVLLRDRDVALVVFVAAFPGIEQELRELDVAVARTGNRRVGFSTADLDAPLPGPSMSFTKRPKRTSACSIS